MVAERETHALERITLREIPIPEEGLVTRIGVAPLENLQEITSKMDITCKSKYRTFEWNGLAVLIEENEKLEIFDEPRPGSEKSQAVYFYESKFRSPGLLLQGLARGFVTSDHRHHIHDERFEVIYGRFRAHFDDLKSAPHFIEASGQLLAPPRTYHQLQGGWAGSVTLIKSSGSEDCLDRSDHDYRPGNRFT